jgi:tRNA 2-selenouridine synthase
MTGTGKTEVLLQLSNGLDLEGHANHRGSSFGNAPRGNLAISISKTAWRWMC